MINPGKEKVPPYPTITTPTFPTPHSLPPAPLDTSFFSSCIPGYDILYLLHPLDNTSPSFSILGYHVPPSHIPGYHVPSILHSWVPHSIHPASLSTTFLSSHVPRYHTPSFLHPWVPHSSIWTPYPIHISGHHIPSTSLDTTPSSVPAASPQARLPPPLETTIQMLTKKHLGEPCFCVQAL